MAAKRAAHFTHVKNSRHTTGQSDPLSRLTVRRASPHGGYGWVRDMPDARDFLYAAPLIRFPQGLPAAVDLRSECPPVYDQGQLGSCTGNGIAGAIEFDQRKQGTEEFTPSRLFIYYNERVIEGTVNQDSGAQIRDGIKVVATLGAPPERIGPTTSPNSPKSRRLRRMPMPSRTLFSSYARVAQDLTQMQGCIAGGYPFVFGFTVYESFESEQVATTGIVPMPGSGETVVGGHCVVAVGYDDSNRTFVVRNSWGTGWGLQGYCRMPYEYLITPHLANDFWTIRSVTG